MKAEKVQNLNACIDKALKRSLNKYWYSRNRKAYDSCIEFKAAIKGAIRELASEE